MFNFTYPKAIAKAVGSSIDVCSVPFKSSTSQCNVPSKYPSLNSKTDVPKSTSLSVVGFKTPSSNWIWEVPSISRIILLSVLKSIFACDDPYPNAKDALYIEEIHYTLSCNSDIASNPLGTITGTVLSDLIGMNITYPNQTASSISVKMTFPSHVEELFFNGEGVVTNISFILSELEG